MIQVKSKSMTMVINVDFVDIDGDIYGSRESEQLGKGPSSRCIVQGCFYPSVLMGAVPVLNPWPSDSYIPRTGFPEPQILCPNAVKA